MRDLGRRGFVAAATGLSIAALAPQAAMADEMILLLDPPPQPFGIEPVASEGPLPGYVIDGAQFRSTGAFRISLDLAPWPDDQGPAADMWYVLAVYSTSNNPPAGVIYQTVTAGVLYQSQPARQMKAGGLAIDRALVRANAAPDRGYFAALFANRTTPDAPRGLGYLPCSVQSEVNGVLEFRGALANTRVHPTPIIHRVTFAAK